MKNWIKALTATTLTLACAATITGCAGGTQIVEVREGTITVGYTDYKPMNYTDSKTGTFMGFDTELAKMTFESLGYNVRFKLIEWDNKYIELNGGTIDCIWNGFTSNGDDDGVARDQQVNFSYNYMQNAQCIVKKTSTATISAYADFTGKKVAFENGSAGEAFIVDDSAYTTAIMTQGKTSQMDAITAVNTGTADYAVVDILLAQAICGTSSYATLTINEGLDIDAEYYAVGFKKDATGAALRDKVNIMFEAFAKTGYLMKLATKYNLQNSVLTTFVD